MLSQIKEWKLYDNLENQSELSWEGKRAVYKSIGGDLKQSIRYYIMA